MTTFDQSNAATLPDLRKHLVLIARQYVARAMLDAAVKADDVEAMEKTVLTQYVADVFTTGWMETLSDDISFGLADEFKKLLLQRQAFLVREELEI